MSDGRTINSSPTCLNAPNAQRFLADGLVSDYDQYRYLMDNALASKDALNLSLGVALTGAQVGALTHDIVWMENRVVEGQTVLVPTLYLAQVDARNVRGSSLIQGRDLNLISGGDLVNVGTLRASRDLRVSSGGSIYQGGLVEAGNNLQLIAQDSIRNAMAGQIRGENVSLAAVRGDVTNERTAIQVRDGAGYRTVTDAGSGVSARQDLAVSAGRDVTNYGTLQAGRDVALQAGNDVSLLAKTDNTQKHESFEGGHRYVVTTQAKQLSSNVSAGSDLNTDAARDINVVASRANAGQNLALDAGQDVNIASAQDENAYYLFKKSSGSFGRKKKHQEETYDSTNVASVIEAGQDLTINTRKAADGSVGINGGRDVNIVGSQLSAGNDLILGATNDVSVNSGVEQHGTYSKTTKSGAFGLSKSGKSQMTRNVDQVGSELTAGNDAVIASGRDVNLRASNLNAENDADIRAGLVDQNGDINLLSANNEASSHQEKYKKKTGLSLSGGFLSFSSAKEAGNEAQGRTAVGSQITAMRDAYLRSERDINVVGSRVDAAGDVGLQAGRDVNVLAAQNTHSSQDWKSKKQSGIGISSDDNGVSLFAGSERNKAKDRLTQETSAASQISAGGDLDVGAKRDINQVGSDLQAFNDINLAAGRDVNVDAASESQVTERERERSRNGLTATINHNFGSTKDAVSGAGKGEDATSKASSTLRAVDSISQFLSGPTADAKFGNSKESSRQVVSQTSNRGSTLDAGNDLNIAANNDVRIRGGQLQSGRDINIQGRDVTLDAAKGSYGEESSEKKSWSGIHGGTSGGFKLGVGGSRGVADSDQSQGSSTVTSLQTGRDANLKASNDLNLIGTQVQTVRDINLQAGNDLNIRAAQNDSASSSSRRSGGGEVGLAVGSEGVGLYASVNLGKGNLKREGQQQQEAYLYAGNQLAFTSGRDSNIAGATLRGNEVVGRVGRDLTVTSLPDTGKAEGKEYDLSATVVVGPGSGLSGSAGYGRTNGSKNWVEKQTSITAQDGLDIRTQNHTQLDGALIASDTGQLKLDTDTLGFSDIAGKDKEHGYYLNVGGSYGIGKDTTQDPSQVGKGDQGQNGWSVEGWNYNKDRQQVVRGTVGAGDVVVRADNAGQDSTAGLNRDVSRAYEVTSDDEHRTDIYVTKSSTEALANPGRTADQWRKNAALYGENSRNATEELANILAITARLPVDVATGQGTAPAWSAVTLTEVTQELRSKDENKRAIGVRKVLSVISHGNLGARGEALVARVTELGTDRPDEAIHVLNLLNTLNPPVEAFNIVPALAVGGVAAVALSAALLNPQSQDNMRGAANAVAQSVANSGQSATQQVSTSIEIWKYLFGTAFPVHLLDKENSKLANPIANAQDTNSSSGGYAAGDRPDSLGTTGGSGIAEQAPSGYSRPEEKLPASEVMYQDSADSAKAIETAGTPLVSKGSEVTPEVIQKALQGDTAISAQGAVSLPAVQRYVDRLLNGDVAPAIKMDGDIIIDGNHRYIAAKILGRNLDVTFGTLSPNKVGQTKPVSELKVDQVDWGNR